jgi:predicted ArsR family transcriptional regulator
MIIRSVSCLMERFSVICSHCPSSHMIASRYSLLCAAPFGVILDVTPRLQYDLRRQFLPFPTTCLQCEQCNRLDDV